MEQEILENSAVLPGMNSISLSLPAEQLSVFFPILQSGVTVPATVGCTLKSLLCDQFAIPAEYVTDRVTTIFLDNRPVDDLVRTLIHDGSRLTLSAAMPGLVGATLRRGGFYAALRQGISHVTENGAASGENGTIRLKLFNLLLAELGPLVLARGLILEKSELAELLTRLPVLAEAQSDSKNRVLLIAKFSG
ncbi:MAG: hypothetical protein HXX17_07220 [Geobacteraceae bacterium]|nr:hypothetical protein [Geobacteraceae bacterium]